MNRFVMALSVVFILSFMSLVMPSKSYACSCALQTDPIKALEQSKVVFSGKVLAIEPQVLDINGILDHKIAVHFDVEKSWKGMNQTQAIVLTNLGEPSCGYTFGLGEPYLVFAYDYDFKENMLETSSCSLTKKLTNATLELSKIGQGVSPIEDVSLKGKMDTMSYTNKWTLLKAIYHRLVRYHLLEFVQVGVILTIGAGLLLIRARRQS
ncbi:hypothetical protein PAECIP111891_06751 [Paenibacillus allorhizoplanae]|uniref:Tissue inhibitor of metalloproteinase n=1 Tax=Paenibacillus allorhizoplanae TaxID=2905648 RepID=A0ABN8H636_9BACL|nr:cobalamin biosynthesis protein CbiN [Paenibacillus allorhizoplanae]CAH1230858.1 hypothetical protein PAECIP111891_06751 [Paenibacillus allorhizoplanae]